MFSTLLSEMDIIQKRGSYYSYNGENLAQGRENCKDALRQKPVLMREIENLVREANGLATLPPLEEGTVAKGVMAKGDLPDAEYGADDEEQEEGGDE